jgi:hypothetical protein
MDYNMNKFKCLFPTSGVVYMEFDAGSWGEVIKLKPVTKFVNFSQ